MYLRVYFGSDVINIFIDWHIPTCVLWGWRHQYIYKMRCTHLCTLGSRRWGRTSWSSPRTDPSCWGTGWWRCPWTTYCYRWNQTASGSPAYGSENTNRFTNDKRFCNYVFDYALCYFWMHTVLKQQIFAINLGFPVPSVTFLKIKGNTFQVNGIDVQFHIYIFAIDVESYLNICNW